MNTPLPTEPARKPRGLLRTIGAYAKPVWQVALLLGVIWFILLTWLVPSDGRVTSQSVSATTPIAGTVTELLVDIGDRVQAGQPLAQVRNPRISQGRLADLRTQEQASRARLATLEDEAARSERELARLRSLLDRRIAFRAGEVAALLREGHAKLTQLEAERTRVQAEQVAKTALVELSVATELERTRADSEFASANAAVAMQRAVIERLQQYQSAIDARMFVGIEVPLEEARIDHLVMRIAELRELSRELVRSLQALEVAVAAEEAETAALAAAVIASPIAGVVFRRTASSGEHVAAGAVLVEIGATDSIRVEAAVHQRWLGDLVIGMRVTVLPIGTGEALTGTVAQITAEESVQSPTVAGAWSPPQDQPMRVLIEVPAASQRQLWIGQLVRVKLTDSAFAPWNWLTRLCGGV